MHDSLSTDPHARRLLIAGPRGSGKTAWLVDRARDLLARGVPARRILIVAFSPRTAARIAARLPAGVDGEQTGGLRVQTARHLCTSLLRECCKARDGSDGPRVISAVERATLLHAAAAQARRELGGGHPLAPALGETAGLAEVELLVEAMAGQGGVPEDLEALRGTLSAAAPFLDGAVLDGVARVYRAYRRLIAQTDGLTYQEVAACAAALLADPDLAGPVAARIDHLLIDDLDRAEPMQIAVLSRLAGQGCVAATIDPDGLISDRARRAAARARELLGLDLEHAVAPPVTGRLRENSAPAAAFAPPMRPAMQWIVAEEQTDTAEAAYVARTARRVLDEAGEPGPDGEPDVLILAPSSSMHAPLLTALRAAGIEATDVTGGEGAYDPAVRYTLAWLRALVDGGDERWERLLASPHARLAAADAARLRRWAGQKSLPLEAAVQAAAEGGCESLSDAAHARLVALRALLAELRGSVAGGEPPSVTLHRLLAREDLIGAVLVGPTEPGAKPPDPYGLGGLYEVITRLEALWPRVYARPPTLATLLDRLEQGLAHLLERGDSAPPGRVVLAGLDDAVDWRARVVVVPGLAERFLPRPRARSPLLSEAALAHLRGCWALPWPADFASYARGERRALALAIAAARERVVLTRALRYDGEEATVPSPLLLDLLGAPRADDAACAAVGARFDRWRTTHVVASGVDSVPDRRRWELLSLPLDEAARDLDTLLYRHACLRRGGDAPRFIEETRVILADARAPAHGRYLSLSDPFAAQPAGACAMPPGARISTHDLSEFLYCPRRFFYTSLVGLRPLAGSRLAYSLLVTHAAQALHRLHPAPGSVTLEDAEEVLRRLWSGEILSDGDAEAGDEAVAFAGRFGPRLYAEAMRTMARGVLRRLAGTTEHAQLGRRTRATGVRVEAPVQLPGGRTVRITAVVDRITEKTATGGTPILSLVDYRSGASDLTPAALIQGFLNRKDAPDWHPRDYTLPVMFLGVAGNKTVYGDHSLPPYPVRELAVVSLGKNKDGYPSYSNVVIDERDSPGKDAITLAELHGLRDAIARAVADAAQGPHPARPVDSFVLCKGCTHRFTCEGPESGE